MVDVLMDDVSCYTFPLDGLRINSNFGYRRGRPHTGIDLDLETGDNVYAAFDGIVMGASYSKGYGNLVVLQHANGLQTYYAHLSKIKVEEGQKLESGELLGLGGSTGRSTGPHLHFEVRYQGAYMDPSNLIDFKTGELKSEILTLEKKSFQMQNDVKTAKYHTVRKGDTLGRIAQNYGTSVSRICKLNGISSTKVIRPGQKIRVR
jgi:murein DD-endopeptidase MepM/ murein hydrolase activator NlpD